ncbi:MAG: cellulase family glycosylhydrolase [Maricaulis sp.]|uniref:glycoside hydrolase family 5 protein n=1 Tax=Maricaulis sp. TaxID=1486257 RepID=UPI002634FE93|nr:cellulase family glycosylhydrolase [Maricaulis sp.]MDM7983140.1 cellulase family glycosylhydrolase [Maricaulis sp.]
MLPLLRSGTGHARQVSKRELWNNVTGPHLRGAVLTQRRVYPEIDGPEFLGPGPIGVPLADEALAALAAAGANLLILSHPGIFTETPPFRLAEDSLANLDDLVRRAARWGLYVVIGYRSGPGRSAFTFHRDDAGSWFPAHMLDDRVWTDFSYHQAWEDMWRTTARHFRARTNVAGYLLMVEPNANQVAVDAAGRPLEIWQADRLAQTVANTPADWGLLARRLGAAVRSIDPETPVLVSPDGYANSMFERNLGLAPEAPEILCVHDYAPRDYTHQAADAGRVFAAGEARFQPPQHPRWMMGEWGCTAGLRRDTTIWMNGSRTSNAPGPAGPCFAGTVAGRSMSARRTGSTSAPAERIATSSMCCAVAGALTSLAHRSTCDASERSACHPAGRGPSSA